VCSMPCEGRSYRLDTEISQWFSTCLGRSCTLVRVAPDKLRHADIRSKKLINSKEAKMSGESPKQQHYIGFANEAQFLILSRGSVRRMNLMLSTKHKPQDDKKITVSEDIFRANFIVDGCEAHDEDKWADITIGTERFCVAGPCSRCSMINIDQSTGEFQAASLLTLAAYRRKHANILFGQFLNHVNERKDVTKTISVGDHIAVRYK